jgi:hypothetical protein
MGKPRSFIQKAAKAIGGVFLSLSLGMAGGGLCGAVILSFGDLIGRSGDTGSEYVGYWTLDTLWLGLLCGATFGLLVGPIAFALVVRRIGFQKAILPAFVGTIGGGFVGAIAGPPLAAITGILGFFAALAWVRIKNSESESSSVPG